MLRLCSRQATSVGSPLKIGWMMLTRAETGVVEVGRRLKPRLARAQSPPSRTAPSPPPTPSFTRRGYLLLAPSSRRRGLGVVESAQADFASLSGETSVAGAGA